MTDRLKELQRQRALLLEHLAWLDREIKAAERGEFSGQSFPDEKISAENVPIPSVSPAKPSAFVDTAAAERAAEEIMAQYQREGQSLQSTVKRGCFLYFFAALGILVLGVLALYFLRSNR